MSRYCFFNVIYSFIGIPWLFLMLFTSGSLTAIKTILLGLLVSIGITDILIEQIKINKNFLAFTIFFIAYCLASLLWGMIKGFQYDVFLDFGLIQYYILTPIFIVVITTSLSYGRERIRYLWKILQNLTLMLVVLDSIRILFVIVGLSPSVLSFIELSSANMDTSLALRVKNESSLFFLLPIFIYMVFNTNNKHDKIVDIIILIFGSLYAAFSGRKTLEIEILISVVFALTFKRNIYRTFAKNLKSIILGVVVLICISPILLSFVSDRLGMENIPELIVNTLKNGLSSDAGGVTKRLENTQALITLWENSPLIGNGLNSYASDSVASESTKWSYEVFYVAWLAQAGIVGMVILLISIVFVIKRLIYYGNKTHDRRYYAIMLGFITFIIAGGTNPLLYFIWPWSIALIFCFAPTRNTITNKSI